MVLDLVVLYRIHILIIFLFIYLCMHLYIFLLWNRNKSTDQIN